MRLSNKYNPKILVGKKINVQYSYKNSSDLGGDGLPAHPWVENLGMRRVYHDEGGYYIKHGENKIYLILNGNNRLLGFRYYSHNYHYHVV